MVYVKIRICPPQKNQTKNETRKILWDFGDTNGSLNPGTKVRTSVK